MVNKVLDLVDTNNWKFDGRVATVITPDKEWSPQDCAFAQGVIEYLSWYYDGTSSEFDCQ